MTTKAEPTYRDLLQEIQRAENDGRLTVEQAAEFRSATIQTMIAEAMKKLGSNHGS